MMMSHIAHGSDSLASNAEHVGDKRNVRTGGSYDTV